MQHPHHIRFTAQGNGCSPGRAADAHTSWRFHSTPDPDAEPPAPNPNPDDIPPPAHAPVQEPPSSTEPPIKTGGWQVH
jgi:hypothetical protein